MGGRGCQGKVNRHYEGEGEQRGRFCLSFSQKAPRYLPHHHPYLLSITHYYSLLSPFALFSLIGKLFHLPLWLIRATLFFWAIIPCPLLPAFILLSYSIPISLFISTCPFPQAKALCHPFHSLPSSSFSPSLSLPTLTLAFSSLQPCRRDETSVCTIHWSRQTPVPPPLSLLLFSLRLHTHTHTQTHMHSWRWGESMKQNAPVNNLSLYSREPKWSLSSWQIHSNSKETGPLLAWIWYWEWKWYSD